MILGWKFWKSSKFLENFVSLWKISFEKSWEIQKIPALRFLSFPLALSSKDLLRNYLGEKQLKFFVLESPEIFEKFLRISCTSKGCLGGSLGKEKFFCGNFKKLLWISLQKLMIFERTFWTSSNYFGRIFKLMENFLREDGRNFLSFPLVLNSRKLLRNYIENNRSKINKIL